MVGFVDFCFFKQKTAYEMRISDWSSDVCSSDLCMFGVAATTRVATALIDPTIELREIGLSILYALLVGLLIGWLLIRLDLALSGNRGRRRRTEEQRSEARRGGKECVRTCRSRWLP